MNDIERIRTKSPKDVNRTTALNSALLWKIWLRIDDCTDEINQPFALPFNEIDTIDDLKTKLLEKLNSTRWSSVNDNASIAIGFYGFKNEADSQATFNDKPTALQMLSTSPVDNTSNYFGRSKNLLQPAPSTAGNVDKVSAHRRCYSVTGSPQRSASNSPRLAKGLRTPLIRYGSASPYGNLHSIARVYSPIPLVSATPLSGGKPRVPGILNKSYRFPSDDGCCDSTEPRILFGADELVINIYNSLFGHTGSQRASDALLIFSNENVQIPESPPPPPSAPLDTLNAATYVPTNEEITQQLLEAQGSDDEDTVQFELNTPPPPGLGLGLEESGGDSLLEPTSSQEDEEEIEREFKLITNEEQLRKESQSLQDAEHNADSPKPAILLLPKDYTGDVDFNQSTSKTSSFPNSPKHTEDDSHQNEETFPISPYAPLAEKEVGMIHPMLESERRKDVGSNPTSPLLPTKPATIVPNLPSHSSSSTSLHQNQLPSGFTVTTNHEIFPKINVLIVEDNVINQAILGSFLKKHKISYRVAKNGQEAVDKWKEGGIDLIFMDLQLPVFSGMDAAKKIRNLEKQNIVESSTDSKSSPRSSSKAPVIIVAFTASNSKTDKREALLSGCNDYLTKPVNLHWLSKKINEWGCMQALIDFDGWKQGQSRMTDRILMKASPKVPKSSEFASTSTRRSRSTSIASHSKIDGRSRSRTKNHSTHPTERDAAPLLKPLTSKLSDTK